MISNNLYLYFQSLRTNSSAVESEDREDNINSNKIDGFFVTVTDIFINSFKNGFISINPEDIRFENKHTTLFFKTALIQIKDCIIFENTSITLGFLLLLAAQDKNISCHELFELKLVTEIIPIIQIGIEGAQKYIDILLQFSSDNVRHKLTTKLCRELSQLKK